MWIIRMEINIRQKKIKNRPDYLFNENMIVVIKHFDFSLVEVFLVLVFTTLNISQQKVLIVDRNNKDFLYLLLDDVEQYNEENNRIEYLVSASTERNKEAFKNYTKLSKESKRQIEVINDVEPIECRKDFMKIKFESDDDLPLDKTFNIPDVIIVIASVLEKNGKYYPQIFLRECADKF